jgi:glucosamine kinase
MDLFLGVDAGGTSTRACVADLRGTVTGRGRAGSANPTTHGSASAQHGIGAAVRQALRDRDARDIRAAVVGMAGLMDSDRAAFSDLWPALGLAVTPDLVSDADVAFAAGTSAANGTVLISGTGAVAARVTGHTAIEAAGGLGWLIGDEGSAFWLGREGLKAVLEGLRRSSPVIDSLASAVIARILGESPARPQHAEPLLTAAYGGPPLALADLAPLVTANAGESAAAAAIVERAADTLASAVARVRDPGERTPIVLAGSVLTAGSPVRAAVRERLRRLWSTADRADAGDTAAAAAWLAARTHSPDPGSLHSRLLARGTGLGPGSGGHSHGLSIPAVM